MTRIIYIFYNGKELINMTFEENMNILTPQGKKMVEGFTEAVCQALERRKYIGYYCYITDRETSKKIDKFFDKIVASDKPIHEQFREANIKSAVIGSLVTASLAGGLYLFNKYKSHKK